MATSVLQEYVYKRIVENFPHYTVKFNYRPEWLYSSDGKRLEIDIYIKQLSTGVEVNGRQHYVFVPFFHKTKEGFKDAIRLDKEKKELCLGNGVRLIEISNKKEADMFISDLCETREDAQTYFSVSALQQKTLKAIARVKRYNWKNNTLHASSLVAKCIKQYNNRKEKDLDSEIGIYYIEHREEVDRLI